MNIQAHALRWLCAGAFLLGCDDSKHVPSDPPLDAGHVQVHDSATEAGDAHEAAEPERIALVETFPPHGAENVELRPTLHMVFDQALAHAADYADLFELSGPGGRVATDVRFVAPSTLVISLEEDLARLRTYSARLAQVRSRSGSSASAEVRWSFTTRDSALGKATKLGQALNLQPLSVATGGGIGVALSVAGEPDQRRVHVSRYDPASGWSPLEKLSSHPFMPANVVADVVHTETAVDGLGNAFVVFQEDFPDPYEVLAVTPVRYVRQGRGWSGDGGDFGILFGEYPSIAMRAEGTGLMAWIESPPDDLPPDVEPAWILWVERYEHGARLGLGWQLRREIPREISDVAVAANSDGLHVVAWLEQFPAGRRVYAASWNGTAWNVAGRLDAIEAERSLLRVGSDNHGRVIAAWLEGPAEHATPVVAHYGPGPSPLSGPHWQEPLALESPVSASQLDLAVNDAGDAVLAWVSEQSSGAYGSYCQAGGAWTAPEELSGKKLTLRHVDATLDAAGDATVSYGEGAQGERGWLRRYHAHSGWLGTPVDTGSGQTFVAAEPAGRVLVLSGKDDEASAAFLE